ncbi:MAG: amidohydrolase [Gemmatimonadota bacterium]|nr:amidohydrolase [Gemmatimonadota bacterium]
MPIPTSPRSFTLALLTMIGGTAPLRSPIVPPNMIFTGGKVFTADSTRPWAQAIAIRGDRIVFVGSSAAAERLAGSHTRVIRLAGRVVVPGFNDAHDHVGAAEVGVSFATDLAPTPEPTLATVLDSVRALVRRTPGGTWLHSVVGLRVIADSAANRTELDRIAPDHPVMLWAWTGHGLLLNTAALRALNIPESARDPLGGSYRRDRSGRLTGMLDDYAEWDALRRLYSSLPTPTLVKYLRGYAAEDARWGLTSVQDMNGYLDPATTVRDFRAANLNMRVRVIPYPMTDTAGLRIAEWAGINVHPSPLTVVSGVKWILDGTPLDRNALMRAPYADRAGWHGRLQFPIDTVRVILARALTTRQPLHLHIVGDSSVRLVLALMQSLAPDSVWHPLRVRIEHGDGLTSDLLPLVRRLGIVVVANPTHFAFEPGMIERRFGMLPAGFQSVRSLVDAGIPIAFGSDGPRNPYLNMMFATTHPNHPSEAITREQAVIAYTRGSAYAESAEGQKGTLAPGMLADLTVLSQDIFTVPAASLPTTHATLTMVGGAIVYENRASFREK